MRHLQKRQPRLAALSFVIVLATILILVPTRSSKATTFVVPDGALDCTPGTMCTISGSPLFTGNISTGDIIDITFAGGAFFTPIVEAGYATGEVSIGLQGSFNSGDNLQVRMYMSGIGGSGDPVTSSATANLSGILGGFDGVNFLLPLADVYDVHLEFLQIHGTESTPGTANLALTGFIVKDRADDAPVITFEQGGAAVIPLPAALPLFGTGLGILGFLGWRRRRKAEAAI